MKLISETKAIEKLSRIRDKFAGEVRSKYEHAALPCSLCDDPGKCCRDEHFVNVRITRLEAAAIESAIREFGPERYDELSKRISNAVLKYDLDDDRNGASKNYACPLFQTGVGCLVHQTAKPLPCIAHACYERKEDLPPDDLLAEREIEIEKLNRMVYGKCLPPEPIPLALKRLMRS